MSFLEMFIISFAGSFLGTITAFAAQYWLHRKQTLQLERLKKSIQRTVGKLKDEG